MKIKQVSLAMILVAVAASASADVTVTTMTAGKASFINLGGEGVNQIKGTRMRSEQAFHGKVQTLIIDIDGRRFVDLDAKKKSAVVTPLDTIADELAKAGVGTIQATLKKTAQIQQIAGFPCTVHDVNLSLPFSPTGESGQGLDLVMVLTGTVCLGTTVPGLADYQAFYKAAADSGFIFGDPKSAKSPTGAAQAKAYAALTRKMAEAGMALETHVMITASGDGPMAGMFAKLAASDITTTVTKIETPPLAADAFEIPAGYKVKTQK
ncbi:MAG: hypothetical protein ABI769_10885 [Pseudomonadota bacterium]